MPLKTLFLNPPSFENYDGGASSRWPATREIESYWYPVWLAYPAGMLEGSRLLDASPHKVNAQETIKIGKDYEFLVLFTSTPVDATMNSAGARVAMSAGESGEVDIEIAPEKFSTSESPKSHAKASRRSISPVISFCPA